MDYDFFVKPMASVPENLCEKLKTRCTHSKWRRHSGFKQHVNAVQDISAEEARFLRSLLPAVFHALRITEAMFLVLPAGGTVKEHSDLAASGDPAVGWAAAHTHKVMLPILTNDKCWSWHRRIRRTTLERNALNVHTLYLYNDYVWHSATNEGDTDRYMIAMSLSDPELEVHP